MERGAEFPLRRIGDRIATPRLAGLGAADLYHMRARRFRPVIVIEAHHAMHFGLGDVQPVGDTGQGGRWGTNPYSACTA